jgi:hypothetical protein
MTNLTRRNLFDTAYDATTLAIFKSGYSVAAPWPGLVRQLRALADRNGFNDDAEQSLGHLREAIAVLKREGASEGAALATGAGLPADGLAGARPGAEAVQRCAALKTLRHTYFLRKRGAHKVWVVAIPKSYDSWPDRHLDCGPRDFLPRLDDEDEQFDAAARKCISDATQTGLRWVLKAQALLGDLSSGSPGRVLLERWFADEDTTEDELLAFGAALQSGLKKIAFRLGCGTLTVTDFVPIRRSTHAKDLDLVQSNAFVLAGIGQDVIYVEPPFFSRPACSVFQNDADHWARIVVHELSHREARTQDKRYGWEGLRPDAASLPHAAARVNADSWAIFVADAAGAMTGGDRARALHGA